MPSDPNAIEAATIRQALSFHHGDDYERAKAMFRGCTSEQMQQEYGQSGQTRQAILDGCAAHVAAVERAEQFINTVASRLLAAEKMAEALQILVRIFDYIDKCTLCGNRFDSHATGCRVGFAIRALAAYSSSKGLHKLVGDETEGVRS